MTVTTSTCGSSEIGTNRPAHILLAAAVVFVLGIAPNFGQKKPANESCTEQRCDTGFRHELHGWATRNRSSKFTSYTGFALTKGGCYGMTRIAQVAFDPRRKNAPGLYQQTRAMDGLERQVYAMTAHALTEIDTRNYLNAKFASPTPNSKALDEIRRTIIATGKPQVLALKSSDPKRPVGHAVLVTKFVQEGPVVKMEIYDPNILLGNVKVWMEYKVGDNAFKIYNSNRTAPVYPQFDKARHDRDEDEAKVIATAKALIEDTKDGQLNTFMDALNLEYFASFGTSRAIKVTKDPKVGGVLVHYDPALFEGESNDEEIEALLDRLMENLQAGRSNIALRLGAGKEESFVTLSLKSWLTSGSRTLGDLTRVRGFIRKEDDILLIGKIEPGRPKIDADLFLVALRAIYRQGRSPGVSLDIDPNNPYGDQKSRVVDLPPELLSTEYVRVMLDADYLMKRIDLGEQKVSISDYQSFYDLARTRPGASLGLNRSWFAPVQSSAGDILENGPAVLFESEIQVLTDQEIKADGDYPVISSERSEPISIEAARNLTRHFRDLEVEFDSFYQLHQLFDVSKLSALLRHKRIRNSVLDAVLDRQPRTVSRKDEAGNDISMLSPYRGIGPKPIQGTNVAIGGGVDVGMRFTVDSFAKSDALGQITEGKTTLSLEPSIPLDENAYVTLRSRVAAGHCLAGRFAECVAEGARVLESGPEIHIATRIRIMRALALFESGDLKLAITEIDRVVRDNPDKSIPVALRASMKLYDGDLAGAKADASEASRIDPNETTWSVSAEINLCDMDFNAAQSAIDNLAAVDPINRSLLKLRGMLRFLRRLSPENARRWIRQELGRPIPIARVHLQARTALETGDISTALSHFERSLELASRTPVAKTSEGLYLKAEALFWIAITRAQIRPRVDDKMPVFAPSLLDNNGAVDRPPSIPPVPKTGAEEADRLIAMHPTWSSGYLVKAFCLLMAAGPANKVQVSALLKKAFSAGMIQDPIADNFMSAFGTGDGVRRYFYVLAYVKCLESSTDGSMFLAELAREQTFEGKLAANLMIVDAVRDQQSFDVALPKLRPFAVEVLATKPKPDFGSNVLWFTFVNAYRGFENRIGNTESSLNATRTLFTYPVDDAPANAVNIVGFMRAKLLHRRGYYYEDKFKKDPEIARLVNLTSQGQVTLDEIERRAIELSKTELNDPQSNFTPLVRSVNELILSLVPVRLQLWALDQDRGQPGRTHDEYQRQLDLKSKIKQEQTKKLLRLEYDLIRLTEDGKSAADLRTIENLTELLIVIDARYEKEAKARLQQAQSVIRARIQIDELLRN